MSENQLAKNIMHYRKKRGLSQEKVAEYMGVSRQAVTKWENNISRPSSDNLIKLAQLFEVNVAALLGDEEVDKLSTQPEISTGKAPWIFIGISALCILVYVFNSALLGIFHIGTLICMFVICIPIQLFLHIYFSNAIKNDSFSGIAGFDGKIEYNICEVKKLLVQINLHVCVISTVYVFLLCVMNCANLKLGRLDGWLNGLLIVVYLLNFITTVVINNYKMIDKIYRKDDDKRRAKRSVPIIVIYILLLFVGIGITCIAFEVKGIENNTLAAMKVCGMFLLGIMSATIGLFLEYNQIKKWNPANTNHRTNKISMICFFMCLIIYGLLCIM